MSYAADGPLEPKIVEEVSQTFFPDVMGYRVLVTQWEDETYTLNIYRTLSKHDEEVLEDGEITYESLPDEETVRLIIEEKLEEQADSRSFCFKCGYFSCQCDAAYENWRESKW